MGNKKISIKELGYKKVRKVIDGVEIYNPNKQQRQEMMKMITESAKIINENNNLNIKTDFDSLEMTRYMFNNLTSIVDVDTLSNEELEELVENPNNTLFKVMKELKEILEEVNKIIIADTERQLKTLDGMTDTMLSMVKMSKIANKLGIPLDTLIKTGEAQNKKAGK